MNLDELQMKAELASLLPWEKSAAEIPYAHKSQFLNAITPEVVLKLLKVVRRANALLPILEEHLFERGPEEEALRTALEELN